MSKKELPVKEFSLPVGCWGAAAGGVLPVAGGVPGGVPADFPAADFPAMNTAPQLR